MWKKETVVYNEEVAQRNNPGHLVFHPLLYNKALISAMRNLKDIQRFNCQSYREIHHKTLNLLQLHKIYQRDGEDWAAFSQGYFEGQAKVSST